MLGYFVWKDFSKTTGGDVAHCWSGALGMQADESNSLTSKWMKVFLTFGTANGDLPSFPKYKSSCSCSSYSAPKATSNGRLSLLVACLKRTVGSQAGVEALAGVFPVAVLLADVLGGEGVVVAPRNRLVIFGRKALAIDNAPLIGPSAVVTWAQLRAAPVGGVPAGWLSPE